MSGDGGMKRSIEEKLLEWKNKRDRKPLILNGARQVGKTYILREFGSSYRLSEKNFGMGENNVRSVPLYAAFCI